MISFKQLEGLIEILRNPSIATNDLLVYAITEIGNYYHHTNDSTSSKLLAMIVRDASILQCIRTEAYISLLTVVGMPISAFPPNIALFRLDTDAQWELVDRICGQGG